VEGFSLLLLFVVLWLVDRLLGATLRKLRSVAALDRALAEALKRGDAAVGVRLAGAPEEQQETTARP